MASCSVTAEVGRDDWLSTEVGRDDWLSTEVGRGDWLSSEVGRDGWLSSDIDDFYRLLEEDVIVDINMDSISDEVNMNLALF